MRPKAAVFAGLAIFLSGCAQPVLYPNDHFRKVGEETARQDIQECMTLAENGGAARSGGLARQTAGGAATGAAAGAAGGAVVGHAGRGAATGAAAGAAARFARGIFGTGDDDTVYQGFVDQCLADKGYDVVGWN